MLICLLNAQKERGDVMSVDKNTAMKLWDDIFGSNITFAQDCFGTWICKLDYGDGESTRERNKGAGYYNYGWDIDHIRPKASYENEKDADFYNNYEPMHKNNNQQKSDNYPHFEVNGKKYKVVQCEICKRHETKGYGVLDVNKNVRIDWKGKKNLYY